MKRQKIMFAVTVVMLTMAGFLVWRGERDAFSQGGTLEISTLPHSDKVVLTWNSDIRPPLARALEAAYRERRDETRHFLIRLNSPGGAIMEGRAAIEVIDRIKRTHRVDTEVGPRARCLSMCVPIFLQGATRTASASSLFMFHEPSAYDIFTEEKIRQARSEREREAARFVARFFDTSPMAPAWRDQLVMDWRGRDVWKTGADLVSEGSGVITDLE